MTFDEAKLAKKPFGKYAGLTLEEIAALRQAQGGLSPSKAADDEGLRHLDWLLGWFELHPLLFPAFQEALKCFFADPAIKADVERLI